MIDAMYCTLISRALAADEVDFVNKKCFHVLNEMTSCVNENYLWEIDKPVLGGGLPHFAARRHLKQLQLKCL